MNRSKNIGYHTRRCGTGEKVSGGSFGGELSMETANRLIKTHHFEVTVKPTGTPVFVDREGREVWLFFTIDARETEKGKAALEQFRAEQWQQAEIASKLAREQEEEISDLMSNMSHEEIIWRLKS
ncbi:MAG: hypothetical protein KC496_00715 [Anaerolineae bacterium]|nr:hypothetical protein [Anaerolineae bacterium]